MSSRDMDGWEAMEATPLIYILSPNELFREGLVRLLPSDDLGLAVAVSDVSDIPSGGGDSIVLIDSAIRERAMEACRELRERLGAARLVLLSPNYDTQELVECFFHGGDAYLVGTMSCEQLQAALRLVQLGFKIPYEPIVKELAPRSVVTEGGFVGSVDLNCLSAREMEIVRHLVEGLPNKLISRHMHISDATVKVHVKAVLRKLQLRNRTQVATWAVRSGLSLSQAPRVDIAA